MRYDQPTATLWPPPSRRAGQAMIELMLGMILILILLSGAMLFLTVADTQSGLTAVIRGGTGRVAMAPIATMDTPRYISNWNAGRDGQRFTADDTATTRRPTTLQLIAGRTVANTSQWQPFANLHHPSTLEALQHDPVPLMALGFIGVRLSTDVTVPQIAQDLFYADATVTVQEESWIPILNGLY